MSSDEQLRLAALERTLVAAAERQAQRRRRRRRRAVVLAAVAAPLTLAAAGSVAATGFFASADRHLSALRDERLEASAHATTWIAGAAGKQPRDAGGRRTWLVGGHRVTGFTAADGSFCFRFAGGAGGCLAKPGLTLATPVDVMIDNAPGTLRVYGLAMDGVTAVEPARPRRHAACRHGPERVLPRGELARKPQRVHRDAYRALRRRDHATGPVTHRRL